MQDIKIHYKTGFFWLSLLIPSFFILYGWANAYTTSLASQAIAEIVYAWEKNIPFLPWTILPYWSIDLLYGLSLFLPMTKFAQKQHALRLLVATPIAVFFFFIFPLTFSTPKPESFGIWKILFDFLGGFDKPYNQAPSLHIMIAVILWQIYLPHFKNIGKILWNIWCLLIAISVLTTYQHHFIDVPTGFAIGVLICFLFPLNQKHQWKMQQVRSKSLVKKYLAGAALLFILAYFCNFWFALILFWIGLSAFTVALGYLNFGPVVFQKNEDGTFTFASKVLHFLYRIIIYLVRKWFFSTYTKPQKISEQIYLGNFKMSKETDCEAIFDLCGEYSRKNKNAIAYKNYPLMDLATPSIEELTAAVNELNLLVEKKHTIFIHCALGLSRSSTVALAWLMFTKGVNNVEEAILFFKNNGYHLHLSKSNIELLKNYQHNLI